MGAVIHAEEDQVKIRHTCSILMSFDALEIVRVVWIGRDQKAKLGVGLLALSYASLSLLAVFSNELGCFFDKCWAGFIGKRSEIKACLCEQKLKNVLFHFDSKLCSDVFFLIF